MFVYQFMNVLFSSSEPEAVRMCEKPISMHYRRAAKVSDIYEHAGYITSARNFVVAPTTNYDTFFAVYIEDGRLNPVHKLIFNGEFLSVYELDKELNAVSCEVFHA